MVARIQIRRDKTAGWEKSNPILSEGEFGLDLNINRLKVGDGETHWNDLNYIDNMSVHIEGDETISGVKTFKDGIFAKVLNLSDSNVAKITNGTSTFLKASETGTVFISGYGNNKKIEFRPNGDDKDDKTVIIDTNGDIIGNKFIGTSTKAEVAINDSLGNNISNTYLKINDLPTIPTRISELENDSNYVTVDELESKIQKEGISAFVYEAGETEYGWYRLWTDGFLEQGGRIPSGSSDNILFHYSFINDNYTLMVTCVSPTNYTIEEQDNEHFVITSDIECVKFWEAKGYNIHYYDEY